MHSRLFAPPHRLWSAERIYVTYGPVEVSVPIESLALFAKEGQIDSNLDGFAQYANESQLADIRSALQAKAEISQVTIAQFLYTPQGEVLLKRLGRLIQTKARQPGFYAIRAALILAASDPERPDNRQRAAEIPHLRHQD